MSSPMSNSQVNVFILIPALNEEKSLPLVLQSLPRKFALLKDGSRVNVLVEHVLVIDNGSGDLTAKVAKVKGCEVVFEPKKGYGQACLSGMASIPRFSKSLPPDIVVFLDADFSDYPEELPEILKPIILEDFDMVLGSRLQKKSSRKALLPQARFGNAFACFLIKIFFHHSFTDLGPFRAIGYQKLLALGMRDRDFGWTVEMQIRALLQGLRIKEVPVSYRRRQGKSKITGTVLGTLSAGTKILFHVFWWKIKTLFYFKKDFYETDHRFCQSPKARAGKNQASLSSKV